MLSFKDVFLEDPRSSSVDEFFQEVVLFNDILHRIPSDQPSTSRMDHDIVGPNKSSALENICDVNLTLYSAKDVSKMDLDDKLNATLGQMSKFLSVTFGSCLIILILY
jgi:hypothetical protein